jgi:DNA-binding response OmpR family regulator
MSDDSPGIILHVDDERPVREAMALLLRAEQYQVLTAATGAEALEFAAQGARPDILILDFDLGEGINGAEAAVQLRRSLGYSPPILMLTGNPASAEVPWITDAPIWLAHKPLNPRLLLAALPGLTQVSRAMRATLAPESRQVSTSRSTARP